MLQLTFAKRPHNHFLLDKPGGSDEEGGVPRGGGLCNKSQFPHRSVNSSFIITNMNNKLTGLCTLCEINLEAATRRGVSPDEEAFATSAPACHTVECYPTVYKAALQRSIPTQIRQLMLYYYYHKELVDEFVPGLTFAKRLYNRFLRNKFRWCPPRRRPLQRPRQPATQ